MFENEIKALMEDRKHEISEKVMKDLQETLKERVVWGAEEVLREEVKAFIQKEILPELRARLLESKEAMINLFHESSKEIAVDIAVAMQKSVQKNLANSYNLKKIFNDLIS